MVRDREHSGGTGSLRRPGLKAENGREASSSDRRDSEAPGGSIEAQRREKSLKVRGKAAVATGYYT